MIVFYFSEAAFGATTLLREHSKTNISFSQNILTKQKTSFLACFFISLPIYIFKKSLPIFVKKGNL